MTKYEVLTILIKEKEYISGEIISKKLGISRAAVNTAVKALKNDGYDIQAFTNKGYKLMNYPDKLNIGELMAFIDGERIANVICLEDIDSTNEEVKRLAAKGAEAGLAVISNHQSKGKGRKGRGFVSPFDKGIYLSYLLKPETVPENISEITAWTAVAMCKAISNICQIKPDIKWINDLLVENRKICGILTEMSVEAESMRVQYIVIGIGINANHVIEDFPEELKESAGSIFLKTGEIVNRAKLAAEMIKELDQLVLDWPKNKEEYISYYRKYCDTIGSDIYYFTGDDKVEARAIGIDENFGLIVKLHDGEEKVLSSGEVSVRKIK